MPRLDLGLKILVVDDSAFARKTLVSELKKLGFKSFAEAEDFKQALSILESSEIGLVLCDHQMPGLTGTDLLHKVRRDESYQSIPFILVTGHSSPEVVAEVAEYGGDSLVVKPFSSQVIQERINQAFRARSASLAQSGEQTEVQQVYLESTQDKAALVKSRVRVDDTSPKGLMVQGLEFEKSGQKDEAQACYQKALEAEPNFILAHEGLARLLKQKGHTEKALHHMEEAVKLSPANHQRRFEFVELLVKCGQTEKAVDNLNHMVQDDRCQYPELLTRVSDTLHKLEQIEAADQALEKALCSDIPNQELLLGIAGRFTQRDKPELAIKALQVASKHAPRDQDLLLRLAQACQEIGDQDAAKIYAVKLLHINPDHLEAKQILDQVKPAKS